MLKAIIQFAKRLFSHFQRSTMKVDNTALSAQIDATAVVITGLLDKVKAAVNDAATIADLQAQVATLVDNLTAANANGTALTEANASLTADLSASQADANEMAAKLEAVKNLAG